MGPIGIETGESSFLLSIGVAATSISTAVIVPVDLCTINKEKLCHGILSHAEKHNKLYDLSDSNGHFKKIMSISFNYHLKRQQIRSIYHIKRYLSWIQ